LLIVALIQGVVTGEVAIFGSGIVYVLVQFSSKNLANRAGTAPSWRITPMLRLFVK
jgi:hypothetical protein